MSDPIDDLVTGGEIARRLGITRERVRQLAKDYDDFPAIRRTVAGAHVRSWREVEAWAETWDRSPGRRRQEPS